MVYNKIIVIGNLTKDIDYRTLNNGSALAKSTLATSHKYKLVSGENKEEVCFIDFTIFGKIANVAHTYLHKGSKIMLEGRLVLESWTGSDGGTRHKHSIMVEEMKMLGDKNSSNSASQNEINTYTEKIEAIKSEPFGKEQNNNEINQKKSFDHSDWTKEIPDDQTIPF